MEVAELLKRRSAEEEGPAPKKQHIVYKEKIY
jgi:hypothetical protein